MNYLQKELEEFEEKHKVWITNLYEQHFVWQTTNNLKREFFNLFKKKTKIYFGKLPNYITENPELYSKLQNLNKFQMNYFYDKISLFNIDTMEIETDYIIMFMLKYDMNITHLRKLLELNQRVKNFLSVKDGSKIRL